MVRKKHYLPGLIFCSIFFLFFMGWLAKISMKFILYERIDGTIENSTVTYRSTVKGVHYETRSQVTYQAGGKTYKTTLHEYGKIEYRQGDVKTVYVDRRNPENAVVISSPKGAWVIALLGVGSGYGVFAGIFNLVRQKEEEKKRKEFSERED